MALKFSVRLLREGLRRTGLATFAVSMFAIVIDKQHTVAALLGMALGIALLLLGVITNEDVDDGGQGE